MNIQPIFIKMRPICFAPAKWGDTDIITFPISGHFNNRADNDDAWPAAIIVATTITANKREAAIYAMIKRHLA